MAAPPPEEEEKGEKEAYEMGSPKRREGERENLHLLGLKRRGAVGRSVGVGSWPNHKRYQTLCSSAPTAVRIASKWYRMQFENVCGHEKKANTLQRQLGRSNTMPRDVIA